MLEGFSRGEGNGGDPLNAAETKKGGEDDRDWGT